MVLSPFVPITMMSRVNYKRGNWWH